MIVDVNGKIALEAPYIHQAKVNTKNLESGIYIIYMEENGKTKTKKVIKK